MNRYVPSLLYLTVFITSLFLHDINRLLTAIMFSAALLSILDKLGKGIALRESIAMLYVLTILLMPVLGYDYYNADFDPARSLGYTMTVPEDVYFRYAMPAVSAFCFILVLPISKPDISDELPFLNQRLDDIRRVLNDIPQTGLLIIVFGLMSMLFKGIIPVSFQYFMAMIYQSAFAGLLYIYFTPNRANKTAVLIAFLFIILIASIYAGVFTIIAYMGITISSFFFLGRRLALWKKLGILMLAVVFMIALQNTKNTYRYVIYQYGSENKLELFSGIFFENLKKTEGYFDKKSFWPIYMRLNQGRILSNVMYRFPNVLPHDNGDRLLISIYASFVPRILWPDKPVADGKGNMRYYAGRVLKGYTSMNVGPMGEAYASYGQAGGVIFMIFLGLTIRFTYVMIFKIGRRIPLLILWIPVIFYQITYSAETDTMQILNTAIKSSIFLWLLYKGLPSLFRGGDSKANPKGLILRETWG